MELLVRWLCPRCQGKNRQLCELCNRRGYLERWMPDRLVKEMQITGKIIARRALA
jgi:hypothetical protein